MTDPGVTVVVATLNRGGFLADCLRDLAAQRHRPLEVLVVDQSPDVGEEIDRLADRHPGLIAHHRVPFRGLPRARNYGWQNAAHDAIVFVDDDIRCGPDFVSEHIRALRRPGVGVVGGGIDEPNRAADRLRRPGVYRRWTATPLRGFGAEGGGEADHAAGCNFSAWRRALVAAGGFDEGLCAGAALYEETDLCLRVRRAGFRVAFHGDARLTHLIAARGGCRVEQIRDYVRALAHNRGVMIRRHGRWFHAPTALGRLAGLGLSYARHYRAPGALAACLAGGWSGLRDGADPPICTPFRRGDAP